MKNEPSRISKFFGDLANKTSLAAGRASTFLLAAGVVVVWGISGPLFQFSDTWQLVINTGTTIVTFLMVFLIQNSQNRDSAAIQVKLDELIRVSAARNSLVGIEHLTDDEIEELRIKCEARARAEKVGDETLDRTRTSARQAAEHVQLEIAMQGPKNETAAAENIDAILRLEKQEKRELALHHRMFHT